MQSWEKSVTDLGDSPSGAGWEKIEQIFNIIFILLKLELSFFPQKENPWL